MTAGDASPARGARGPIQAWDIFTNILTVVLALVFGFPLFWAVSSALKLPIELNVIPPLWFPPALDGATSWR